MLFIILTAKYAKLVHFPGHHCCVQKSSYYDSKSNYGDKMILSSYWLHMTVGFPKASIFILKQDNREYFGGLSKYLAAFHINQVFVGYWCFLYFEIIYVIFLELTHCGLVMWNATQHRSGSTLAQVMACWLMKPSHYLNQYQLIIKGILLHSFGNNFTRSAYELINP